MGAVGGRQRRIETHVALGDARRIGGRRVDRLSMYAAWLAAAAAAAGGCSIDTSDKDSNNATTPTRVRAIAGASDPRFLPTIPPWMTPAHEVTPCRPASARAPPGNYVRVDCRLQQAAAQTLGAPMCSGTSPRRLTGSAAQAGLCAGAHPRRPERCAGRCTPANAPPKLRPVVGRPAGPEILRARLRWRVMTHAVSEQQYTPGAPLPPARIPVGGSGLRVTRLPPVPAGSPATCRPGRRPRRTRR